MSKGEAVYYSTLQPIQAQNGRLARVLLFCPFAHDGRGGAAGIMWLMFAALMGGRAAAAFLFGWHGFLLVGRFAARKNACQRLSARRGRAFLYPHFARFSFLSLFVFGILFFSSLSVCCYSICFPFLSFACFALISYIYNNNNNKHYFVCVCAHVHTRIRIHTRTHEERRKQSTKKRAAKNSHPLHVTLTNLIYQI